MNKDKLKEVVKTIVSEEQDYKEFFKKALEKAGKSIPSMSDEEKKAFFNKIDSAWNARGEKNEELHGNQHKLDVDGDGEIEASDLAKLRAKKDESVNEGKKRFYQQDNIGSSKYTINYHDGKSKNRDGSDFYGIKIFKNKKDLETFRKELLKKGYREDSGSKNESVNEDIDLGHQDDEPNMLRSTVLELVEFSTQLLAKLEKYDEVPQEVDFPNWWQAKVILGKEYIQKAYQYLDSEEKTGK